MRQLLRRVAIALLIALGVVVQIGAYGDVREGAQWDLFMLAQDALNSKAAP